MRYLVIVVQMESGLQYIRSVVGDQFSYNHMIEAMKLCNMDAEGALSHLLEKGVFNVISNDVIKF